MQMDEAVQLLDALIAKIPGIERKGDKIPYLSVNGNMYAYFDSKAEVLALRLPAAAREEFVAKYSSKLHEAYGIVQKEYVDVPDELFRKTTELLSHFKSSWEYACALKPKPATKKKKS